VPFSLTSHTHTQSHNHAYKHAFPFLLIRIQEKAPFKWRHQGQGIWMCLFLLPHTHTITQSRIQTCFSILTHPHTGEGSLQLAPPRLGHLDLPFSSYLTHTHTQSHNHAYKRTFPFSLIRIQEKAPFSRRHQGQGIWIRLVPFTSRTRTCAHAHTQSHNHAYKRTFPFSLIRIQEKAPFSRRHQGQGIWIRLVPFTSRTRTCAHAHTHTNTHIYTHTCTHARTLTDPLDSHMYAHMQGVVPFSRRHQGFCSCSP